MNKGLQKFCLLLIILISGCNSFAQKSFFVQADDVKLYVKVFGEKGEPLLLINGGPGMNSNGFEPLARKLSTNNRVILYDQRGTGKSVLQKIDSSTINMDLMVKDIESIRKKLGLGKWIIMGHSFGGMLGSYYCTKHPKKVKKLILSSSGGVDLSLLNGFSILDDLDSVRRDSFLYWNDKMRAGDTTFHVRYKRAECLAPAYLYSDEHVPQIAKRLTQGDMEINRLIWDDMRRMSFDCKPKLNNFKSPVLILQGKNDVMDTSIAIKTHELLPNSKLILLDKCAHYGWLDQSEKYFEAIHQFLN